MARKAETSLHEKIIVAMRLRGAFVEKIHGSGYQRKGLPDILACYRGRFIGIEVKVPGEEDELTDTQSLALADISAAGGLSAVVSSVKTVTSILDHLDAMQQERSNV